jgi:hypothetical protein
MMNRPAANTWHQFSALTKPSVNVTGDARVIPFSDAFHSGFVVAEEDRIGSYGKSHIHSLCENGDLKPQLGVFGSEHNRIVGRKEWRASSVETEYPD